MRRAVTEILSGSGTISFLSVLLAFVAGGILIAATNARVTASLGYFFSRPGDTIAAIGDAVFGAYSALFQGAVFNFSAPDLLTGLRPLADSLTYATPLIAAGLGVAIAFRAGLFNIGGRGQMLVAAACSGAIGIAVDLPYGLHLVVAVLGGVIGGALWGGIAGYLKARNGAHEVIVTIMLNYIAFYLVSYLLRTPGLLQAPGSVNPKTAPMQPTAVFPELLGPGTRLHAGFLLVIAVTFLAAWFLNRSRLGFTFRAIGENPDAARIAGMKVPRSYLQIMLISGGLVGLAGSIQVLGTVTTGFGSGIDAAVGFDAITVALLGRSRPWGVFCAGILFGGFKAGGFVMQASQGVSIDIVVVVQALIVLFIAAPPLIRAVFRLPEAPRTVPRRPRALSPKESITV
ncbi:ABC transporter permease [Mycetocola tolaasinivorans]|uniref:ABC transporter permease n=2 Tax=Mycetocola tolaasinivorans TaxID=76635 RepID=A0A3L7ACX0_9MICO|nr:ABC transporter permease [Mycetocola tolaasinivorans]